MKIALVTAFPRNPAAPSGGVESVSVNLVKALAVAGGLEVHVITTDRGSDQTQTQSWSGATIHRLAAGNGSLLTYSVGRGRRQVQEYLRHLAPDVVHAHDTYGIMVRGLALPRVFTVHGFIHEDTKSRGGMAAWMRSRLWRRAEIAGWADQPHIISISPFVRERLRHFVRGEIHDIENPLAEEFFDIQPVGRAATIFSAAGIRRLKNTLGLVKAFAILSQSLPQARLRLAGPVVEPDYAREIGEFIQANGLTEKVTLLGSLNAEAVRHELGGAAVFALVSLLENAPMCIAEAMAAGLPVVASNRSGIPYMVRDGETGFLVDETNPAGIAQALNALLTDAPLRAKMGASARKAAMERFHPRPVATETIAVYQRAVATFAGGAQPQSLWEPPRNSQGLGQSILLRVRN